MPTHKKTESERFKGPAKYMEYLFARALITLLQRLPLRLAHRIGRVVGWVCWKFLQRRRLIVQNNLEIVNAWLAEDESRVKDRAAYDMPLENQVREVFLRSGANLFSGFTFNRMSPEKISDHIQVEGIDVLKEALAEGKGAIILLAHMGPWEALAQLPGLAKKSGIDAPFGAMYRPLNNAYLDEWYRTQREAQGTRLFSRRDGFHKPVDFTRAGGMLGILADQKMRQGVTVPYFGVDAKTSPIPGLFHKRSDAPVLSLSISTLSWLKWKIASRVVNPSALAMASSREDFAFVMNQALEGSLAESPLDGFWFQKRF